MLKRLTLPTLLLGCSCLPAFAGDALSSPATYHELNVLGTSLDLLVNAPSRQEADRTRVFVLEEVERLRRTLSTYDPGADLARVNASTEPVEVAPEVVQVLELYEQWRQATGGRISAGTGSLTARWKEAQVSGRVPSAAELERLLPREPLWRIDAAARTVQRLTRLQLNIDSLGKGFIVSQAAHAALRRFPSVKGLLLNIGGDITALGSAEPGRSVRWTVPIADPRDPADNGPPIALIRFSDLAIATSGASARALAVGDRRFSHIIDPQTGVPAELSALKKRQVLAATVIAPDNLAANALAATLCLLSIDEGLALIDKTPGTGCLLALADGSCIRSELFRHYEIARADAPLDQSTIASADAPRWPAGYSVSLPLQITPLEERTAERPYLAIWIEDSHRQHVKTLAVWGNEPRWLPSLTAWWKFGKTRDPLLAAVTRATRPAGRYAFSWDGRDQSGLAVPTGTYTLWVETAFEHGGHVLRSAAIECRQQAASVELKASPHTQGTTITFGPGGE
jgi:thiamine biosynthesis lipoprotein